MKIKTFFDWKLFNQNYFSKVIVKCYKVHSPSHSTSGRQFVQVSRKCLLVVSQSSNSSYLLRLHTLTFIFSITFLSVPWSSITGECDKVGLCVPTRGGGGWRCRGATETNQGRVGTSVVISVVRVWTVIVGAIEVGRTIIVGAVKVIRRTVRRRLEFGFRIRGSVRGRFEIIVYERSIIRSETTVAGCVRLDVGSWGAVAVRLER